MFEKVGDGMNKLESCQVESPYGILEGCAKFIIDDADSMFVLSKITQIGSEYTLSFWIKSDSGTSVKAANSILSTTSDWQKYSTTFVAVNSSLIIEFLGADTYYIYHPKLELGTVSTDWSPAPEDMATADDINSVNNEIESVAQSVSALDIKADNIAANVTEIKTNTDIALESANDNIEHLRKEVETKMTAEAVEIQIRAVMQDGVTKVETETGFTFNDDGLMIEKSGSEMRTQITEDGMTVYQNDEAVLTANNTGVDAKNLRATTYLIVGGRSRFENYGSNRTGCFWIGG